MLLLLLLLSSIVPGSITQSNSDWEPAPFLQNGETLYACVGDSVTFDWKLNSNGSLNTVKNIQFNHQNEANLLKFSFSNPDTLASINIRENKPESVLLSSDENYDERIEVNDRVMTISSVKVADSGLFSMAVKGEDMTGTMKTVTSTVTLVVADDIMTTDKSLHISESDTAFFNETSGRHHKVLECGEFTYKTTPPFDVAWTVPGMSQARSTEYRVRDGRFRLVLPLRMRTGSYGCSVTKNNAARACAKQLVQDRIDLDATETRFWLLGQDLERAQSQIRDNNATMLKQEQDLENIMNTKDSQLDAKDVQLSTLVAQLSNKTAELSTKDAQLAATDIQHANKTAKLAARMLKLENDLTTIKASFYARNMKSREASPARVLVFKDVDLNVGGGYSSTTGVFTAPFPGVYEFAATLGVYGNIDKVFQYQLEVNGQSRLTYYHRLAKTSDNTFNIVPMTAVLRLAKGDTVGIKKTDTVVKIDTESCSFSGMLVDPKLN